MQTKMLISLLDGAAFEPFFLTMLDPKLESLLHCNARAYGRVGAL
jgi:hypothetical protein